MADIYINYGADGRKMVYELLEEADVISKIKTDMQVMLKPNLVVSRPAEGGATTHPEIAEGVIRYLKEGGVQHITIAEGAWVGDSTQSAFQNCGYKDLGKRYGVKLLDTKRDKVVKVQSQGMELSICASVLEADYLINLPVLKAHCQTDMTCCLKNLKGCIPDSEKRRFHTIGLHKPIAALAAALRPQLHIVDSICGDLSFEEGGNPVQQDRILLGFDPVMVDSYCAGLLGYRPDEIDHLRYAAEYGAGVYCDDTTRVVVLGSDSQPKSVPTASRTARRLGEFIQEDCACSACYASLIFALDKVGGRMVDGEKIKIGQGFRGKSCGGLGVGNCTGGFQKFVPGCPPRAVDIVEVLRRR